MWMGEAGHHGQCQGCKTKESFFVFDIHRAVHRNIISIVRSTRCTKVSNTFYFGNDTLHISDGLSVHHQEFKTVYTATGICQTDTAVRLLGGLAVSVWHIPVAVCTVLNTWWWTERPSETFPKWNKFDTLVHLVGFTVEINFLVSRAKERGLSVLQILQTISATHIASYIVGIWTFYPWGKASAAWVPRINNEWSSTSTYPYVTQLLIPTHAHFHWLKFIKNI